MLKALDEGVARILSALRREGLEENTLVVFSSDNGPQFGGAGENDTTRFNCHWHGAKGSTYEGGIRVPGLLRWPSGGLSGGRGAPTIDGVNVLPVLQGGGSGAACTKRFWQWNRYSPVVTSNAAARDGAWKLVRPAIREAMTVPDIQHLHTSMYNAECFIENGIFRGDPDREIPEPPAPELYNIADDPLEERNLADERPKIRDRLVAELEAWFADVEQDRRSIDDEWVVNPESGW